MSNEDQFFLGLTITFSYLLTFGDNSRINKVKPSPLFGVYLAKDG